MYNVIKNLLFLAEPEKAHALTMSALNSMASVGFKQELSAHRVEAMGLTFPNPIGMAAGFDNNGECIKGLASLGFGFIEVGGITPKAQAGNPKPRVFRLQDDEALINRKGFCNAGVDELVNNIKKAHFKGILGVNIGKNKETPLEKAVDDYVYCLEKCYAHVSYITLNISSPNTPGLRDLQQAEYLGAILKTITEKRDQYSDQYAIRRPLVVKISPDMDLEQLKTCVDQCLKYGIDGIIATNTTVSREDLRDKTHAQEQGGLSGAPLFAKSIAMVETISQSVDQDFTIIACGGINSAERAVQMLQAGAKLIQLYTGLIYGGPHLLKDMSRNIARL